MLIMLECVFIYPMPLAVFESARYFISTNFYALKFAKQYFGTRQVWASLQNLSLTVDLFSKCFSCVFNGSVFAPYSARST